MATKSKDDTKDIVVEYIPMDVGSACDYKYDKAMFEKGIDVGSYLTGVGTAIRNMNSEIDKDDIVEILKSVIENDYGLRESK